MQTNQIANAKSRIGDAWARVVCATLLTMTGATSHAAGEFTDRVSNAKAIDTKSLRDSSKQGADNVGFIVGMLGAVVGLVFFIWGILWVMSASRSEGRKSATAGWVMMIGGGCLGAGTAVYLLFVGVFAGAAG